MSNPQYRTSEEAFMDSIRKGEEQAKAAGDKTRQIKLLRQEMQELVKKSTFTMSPAQADRFASEAKNIKKRIELLESLGP